MLKYKDFQQEEFKIIGFKQKKVVNGKITLGAVILETVNGHTFNASPSMNDTEKQNIWENQSEYMNYIATVKFFEMTPKGVPRFPVLLGFRCSDDC